MLTEYNIRHYYIAHTLQILYISFMRSLRIANPESVAEALQDEIRRSEESRYDHRLHAVLLVTQGLSLPEVANWLGDSVRAVELWVHHYQEKSLAGLRESQRPGRPSRLSEEQMAQTRLALRSSPSAAGLSAGQWDSNVLSVYLRALGVHLKPRQCRNLLRKFGLAEPT
jgi:transposase